MDKILVMTWNLKNLQIEDRFQLEMDELKEDLLPDFNFVHHEVVQLNGKIFFLFNCLPKESVHVYMCDLSMKKYFPIKNIDSRPSDLRINYSLTLWDYKMVIFGGLDE